MSGLILIGMFAAGPASAQDTQGRRERSDRGARAGQQEGRSANPRAAERQAPREAVQGRQNNMAGQRQYEAQRQYDARRESRAQGQYQAQRQYDVRRQSEPQRQYAVPRGSIGGRDYPRPYSQAPYYANRAYGYRAPRIIRPSIVTIVPYRPYVYRPSLSLGVYYGSGGSYPYGYTPRGYYDPIPGGAYGGVRITGAPRGAQVFADGYYVGIVDDFDGIFQHVNLEAGPHHIEIQEPGFESIAFDIFVEPGRTITFRAGMYPY
jgi:hypothetical protein